MTGLQMDEGTPAQVRSTPPKGFDKRFVASEPRLSEAVESYRMLGFEVVLVPALEDQGTDERCNVCLAQCFAIYTRRGHESDPDPK